MMEDCQVEYKSQICTVFAIRNVRTVPCSLGNEGSHSSREDLGKQGFDTFCIILESRHVCEQL